MMELQLMKQVMTSLLERRITTAQQSLEKQTYTARTVSRDPNMVKITKKNRGIGKLQFNSLNRLLVSVNT